MSQTLGIFLNTLTADDMYSLCKSANLRRPIQMQLYKKQKNFPSFFINLSNLYQILNNMKQKMTLISSVRGMTWLTFDLIRFEKTKSIIKIIVVIWIKFTHVLTHSHNVLIKY